MSAKSAGDAFCKALVCLTCQKAQLESCFALRTSWLSQVFTVLLFDAFPKYARISTGFTRLLLLPSLFGMAQCEEILRCRKGPSQAKAFCKDLLLCRLALRLPTCTTRHHSAAGSLRAAWHVTMANPPLDRGTTRSSATC